ncbi:MAG: IS91 family transposase [Alphaproteobacteria bacterium]|nr:IS91 family transposase [Alphaproteobacteria bacterium]MBV8408058.1 IS91 family transposase [Alphaproteobacteria bacterium]
MAARPAFELAEVFRRHGESYERANAEHLGRVERRVIGAITICRTAALGGHVEQCDDCGAVRIAYNSCRNRHCPKCQGSARAEWLAARQAELLPVPYFHVVFTLPPAAAEVAFQNKQTVYGLLMRAAAEALMTLAAERLCARIGLIAVLHTWGQTLTHHPHVHCLVPGGGVAIDGKRWLACKPNFLLSVRALSKTFRRLFLDGLEAAFHRGELGFFGDLLPLAEAAAFAKRVRALRKSPFVVYAKPPFGGPERVLAYLARYTHRTAIANSRLAAVGHDEVAFSYKDYRRSGRSRIMRLAPNEFIRRFLLHVLPDGFHRIRHYGFLARAKRAQSLERVRALVNPTSADDPDEAADPQPQPKASQALAPCPDCGGQMRRIGSLASTSGPFRCDTS